MTRRLTAARATVASPRRDAYLAAVAELAAAHRRAGGHFWLFERAGVPGEFLEFAEHQGPVPDAMEVAPHLAALADYDGMRDVEWHEVPLGAPSGG